MSETAQCRCCGYPGEIDKFTPDTYAYVCTNLDDCGIIGPNRKTQEEALGAWNFLMIPTYWTHEEIDAANSEAARLAAAFKAMELIK